MFLYIAFYFYFQFFAFHNSPGSAGAERLPCPQHGGEAGAAADVRPRGPGGRIRGPGQQRVHGGRPEIGQVITVLFKRFTFDHTNCLF